MPDISDTAPDFTLPRDGGGDITLSDNLGQPVILFFYPRDDTPGCTRESIGFSEKMPEFTATGATVLGISRDSVAKHDRFVARHGLTTTLLSDESGAVCEAYGVWVEKTMYGRKSMGIARTTFLIGADGRIARIWRKVKVPGHVAEVLDAAQAL